MKRMIKDVPQKVFIVLDDHKVHHGKLVQKWLMDNKDKIEVFYQPQYVLELIPDEYPNNTLKHNVHLGINAHYKKDIYNKAQSFMRMLQHKLNPMTDVLSSPKLAYPYFNI